MPIRLGRAASAFLLIVAVCAGLAGVAAPANAASGHANETRATAVDLLAALPVKGRAPMTGYARTADFGNAWMDMDRNGCDTRNDILARDLSGLTRSGRCKVLAGRLISPYTNQVIKFVRGQKTSALVQIDHVVALGDAWQTGAQQLTKVQREALANDPINLLAVDGRSNEQKSSSDAASWLPSNKGARCMYVARQISVKSAYRLWVTQGEHDAMARILTTCSTQVAFTSKLAPKSVRVASSAAPAPAAPVVVAPVPVVVPVPAAPAPAPVPAAPAPAAPAPAPAAPAAPVSGVSPGAFCPNSAVGTSGVAANGRTYVCGGKGADANGHYHWNA
jgi:hypothetical protein